MKDGEPFLSERCLHEVSTAARSCGLNSIEWMETVLLRVARGKGMPAGAINPNWEDTRPKLPTEGERIASALDRIGDLLEQQNKLYRDGIEAANAAIGHS